MSLRAEAPHQKLTGDDCTETPDIDTPQTDALMPVEPLDVMGPLWAIHVDKLYALARQLERELNAKTRELEEARKLLEKSERAIRSLARCVMSEGWTAENELALADAIDSAREKAS
jgi:hypothetical protein